MIILKSRSEIKAIKKACFIVSEVLYTLKKEIQPGITTNYLNNLAEDKCRELGAVPGFKGYKGFPYSICASVNHVIVHGFSNDTPLQSGDIISIDFGAIYNGWYGDSAFTTGVGKISKEKKLLINTCRDCLFAGINQAKVNNRIGDISSIIEFLAKSNGYGVVKEYVGHGIGRNLHEEPQIPNYGFSKKGYKIKAGLVIAIEPMLTIGSAENKTLSDNWTVVTKDNSLAAHFEHTIAITEGGVEILTLREDEF